MKGRRFLSSGLAAILVLVLMAGLALAQAPASTPLGTAFTYQGQLKSNDAPYTGTCDLRFKLYDALSGGNQIGPTQTKTSVSLSGGYFTLTLDFGSGSFAGDARWLNIEVCCPTGGCTYTPLTPRQPLTAAPAAQSLVVPLRANGSSSSGLLSLSNDGAGDGLRVELAGRDGVYVVEAADDGVYVNQAGSPSQIIPDPDENPNGFEVDGAAGYGLFVGRADWDGVAVASAAGHGVRVGGASLDGVHVSGAGWSGVAVNTANEHGVYVHWAGADGVYVNQVGNPSQISPDPGENHNGLEVAGAASHGVHVGWADLAGVYVLGTGGDGLFVYMANGDGVNVAGTNYAGSFWGSIYVQGGCVGCALAAFGTNVGSVPLQPGDVVSVQGMQPSALDNAPQLWLVAPAGEGAPAAGVVRGRAELDVAPEGRALREGEAGQRLAPREGAAGPGEYVTIIFSGPIQAQVSAAAGPIAAGARLAVGTDGRVRALRTVTVDGISVAESAPMLGIALEAAEQDGLIWVLVSLR